MGVAQVAAHALRTDHEVAVAEHDALGRCRCCPRCRGCAARSRSAAGRTRPGVGVGQVGVGVQAGPSPAVGAGAAPSMSTTWRRSPTSSAPASVAQRRAVVTSTTAPLSPTTWATCRGLKTGFTGTKAASARDVASIARTVSIRLSRNTATRSPRRHSEVDQPGGHRRTLSPHLVVGAGHRPAVRAGRCAVARGRLLEQVVHPGPHRRPLISLTRGVDQTAHFIARRHHATQVSSL